ncbi:MAG TPA: YchJ family metal-binding protein [Mycobacteriales bacterium]|nr:YchJ family metal-binding protein [Mycobacteriales bacterium]
MARRRPTPVRPCPCGRALYPDCCGPLLAGQAQAETAIRLMRSRYTAFALGDEQYLLSSWHGSTRPVRVPLEPDREWLRLEVLATQGGGLLEPEGRVEFRAYSRRAGAIFVLHEHSRFVREGGLWRYLGNVAG